MGPRDADQLYIWEIAVLLGHAKELGDDAKERAVRDDFRAAAIERNRQRLQHAQGKGPKPVARAVSSDQLNQLSKMLN